MVFGLITFVGFYIWSRQNTSENTSKVSTTRNQNNSPKSVTNSNIIENKYFSIKLPSGWSEDTTTPYSVSKDASYMFVDAKGRKAVVVINLGNVGGAGDALGSYTVVGKSFKFNNKLIFCTPGFSCDYGDGKLRVEYSSAEKVNGNNYFFDISDDNAETQTAADAITAILETIQVK